MLFDSSPATMIQLQNSLKKNENVIRHTVVKMGDSLSSISEYKDPREI
jgi:ribosomal protein S6